MNAEGFRVDINPEVNPDLVCDVHELSMYLDTKFDIIFADPPYSDEEAKEIYARHFGSDVFNEQGFLKYKYIYIYIYIVK